jgi:hypothetical protein
MKLYKYTLLRQDGTTNDLGVSVKKDFKVFYNLLDCRLIEIIPSDYVPEGQRRATYYGDEEARYNTYNHRNPHFLVLKDAIYNDEWDVVGDIIKEEVFKG